MTVIYKLYLRVHPWVSIMTNALMQKPGLSFPCAGSFKTKEVMCEGLRFLPDKDVRSLLRLFTSKHQVDDLYLRYLTARDKLKQEYGGVIGLMDEVNGGPRVFARLEFLTRDETINDDIFHTVRGMGFDLLLRSRPVPGLSPEEAYESFERTLPNGEVIVLYKPKIEHVYVITEHRNSSSGAAPKIADTAHALLRLATLFRPSVEEDLPQNVVELVRRTVSEASPSPAEPQVPKRVVA